MTVLIHSDAIQVHKRDCQPKTKADKKKSEVCKQATIAFCQNNYVHIMRKVVEVCNTAGLKKVDVLLELDFAPDSSGTAPALRHPPEFSVKGTRGYYEGSRPNEPDWFNKRDAPDQDEDYQRSIRPHLDALRDIHGRITSNHLLCLVRHDEGLLSCYRVQMTEGLGSPDMFGDEAFDAFCAAINNCDYDPLSSLFPSEIDRFLETFCIGPSRMLVEDARMALNAMCGVSDYVELLPCMSREDL